MENILPPNTFSFPRGDAPALTLTEALFALRSCFNDDGTVRLDPTQATTKRVPILAAVDQVIRREVLAYYRDQLERANEAHDEAGPLTSAYRLNALRSRVRQAEGDLDQYERATAFRESKTA